MDDFSDRRFAQLTSEEIAAAKKAGSGEQSDAGPRPVPPPPDAEPAEKAAAFWGRRVFGREPDDMFPYRGAQGEVLHYVLRWDRQDGDDWPSDKTKEIRPMSWVPGAGWRLKGWPDGRPLFNLDELAFNPEAPVIVVEGERKTLAAHLIFPHSVITTSSGGAGATDKTDWSPLSGRDVTIWRDDDDPGLKYEQDTISRLTGLGSKISTLDVGALRAQVSPACEAGTGWDATDAIADCTDLNALKKAAMAHARAFEPLKDLLKKVAADPGAAFTSEALEALAALKKGDRAAFEALRVKLKKAGCRVSALDEALDEARAGASGESVGRNPKQADVLIELASAVELFHTDDGTGYADVEVNGHRETWAVRSRGFKRWLTRRFFETAESAPNSDALQSALGVIEAKADNDAPERKVHVRVAGLDGKIYLDLCDTAWRAVEIDAEGWRVVDSPPVRFRRSASMQPLPVPTQGGSVEKLRPFLNLKATSDFILVMAWLVATLRDCGPYPVLVLLGDQGTAKSSFSKILKDIIDPSKAKIRSLPREDRDLFIAATNSHMLAYDNISGLPVWISDTLCRLSTGGGFAVRQLYSDQDEVLFDAMRPIVLNGIENVAIRADLADRALFLKLEPIPDEKRRAEKEFWKAFEAERPAILGALLDAVARGLKRLPETKLPGLPRMADFALWATACEKPKKDAPSAFWAAYAGNREHAVEDVLEADPVATAVRDLMKDRDEWGPDTASALLRVLSDRVGERAAKSKGWPIAANALSGRLHRAATNLRKVGIEIIFERESHGGPRHIKIVLVPKPKGQTDSSGDDPGDDGDDPRSSATKDRHPISL